MNNNQEPAVEVKSTEKRVYSNLEIIWHNLASFYSSIIGLVVLCLVGAFAYWLAYKQFSSIKDDNKNLKLSLEQREDELFKSDQELNFLRVELEVEKVALQSIQNDLKTINTENAALKKELTFFQNVMAPESTAQGVMLDDFYVETSLSDTRFRYHAALVHTRKQKRYAKGHIKVVLFGQKDNKTIRYDLKDLLIEKQSLKFSFQYFQILEGDFELPKGFEPERIEIAVISPKKKWQKYKRSDSKVDWQPKSRLVDATKVD